MYWALIILFLIVLPGAGWMLRRSERVHQEELAILQKENERLRGMIRLLNPGRCDPQKEEIKEDAFLQDTEMIINEGLISGDISVEGIASKMNMSSQTFRRRLLAANGSTPKDFILSIQMEKAASLLLNEKNMPVQEVGRRCAFDDASSFAHCFKRYYGCSPSEYRNTPEG